MIRSPFRPRLAKELSALLLMIVLVVCIVGCTDPMDIQITKENYSEVVEKIRKSASPDDWKRVEAAIAIARLGRLAGKTEEEVFEGRSFNQVLDGIRQKQALDAKAAKDEEDRLASLSAMFEAISWTKGASVDRFGINRKVNLTLELRNKSEKDFDAFEGHILVFDKLQNQLGKWRIKETSALQAGEKRKLSYEFPTIDFINKAEEIYRTKGTDLRFKFEATKILLKDGTTL